MLSIVATHFVDSLKTGSYENMASLPDFDLTLVHNHMVRRHPEMDSETVCLAESEYRNFLKKCKEANGSPTVPGHLADKFWHAHILHTRLYMRQCMDYFGYYLHHTPKVMDVKTACSLGECFCNGDAPAGGGFDISKALKPTQSCSPVSLDCHGDGGDGGSCHGS